MNVIKKGYGFNVGQDFSRAAHDTPIELSPAEDSGGFRYVIGYIPANPASGLGFLRNGTAGRIRVQALVESIGEAEGDMPAPVPPGRARLMADNEVPAMDDMVKEGPRSDWSGCGFRFSGLPIATIRQRRDIAGLYFATYRKP